MWGSRTPELITALVQRFAAWPDLDGVTVLDGPQIGSDAVAEFLSVGWTGVEGETDAESSAAPEGLGGAPDREAIIIRCAAAVLLGSVDIAAARKRAYEITAAAGSALASDRTLGRVALRAHIASTSLTQTQLTQGAQAVVVFTVECDAFTTR